MQCSLRCNACVKVPTHEWKQGVPPYGGDHKDLEKINNLSTIVMIYYLTLLLVIIIFNFQKNWSNLSLITTNNISMIISEMCEHATSTIYLSNSKNLWTMLIYVHITNNFTFMCEHIFSGACVNWPNFERENVWNPILVKNWILDFYAVSKNRYWHLKFNVSHTLHLKITKFSSSPTHWWLSNHFKNTSKFFVIILFNF